LTGKMVFDEPSATAMALAHVQKQPVPPSELGVAVPAGLEAIVMQLLQKKPEDRIQNAEELHRRIRGLKDLPNWCEDAAMGWWQTHLPETTPRLIEAEEDEHPTTAEAVLQRAGAN